MSASGCHACFAAGHQRTRVESLPKGPGTFGLRPLLSRPGLPTSLPASPPEEAWMANEFRLMAVLHHECPRALPPGPLPPPFAEEKRPGPVHPGLQHGGSQVSATWGSTPAPEAPGSGALCPLAPRSPLSDPKANARPAHRGSPRLPALALALFGAPLRPLEACRRRPQETHWSWTQRPGHPCPASRCPTGAHAHPGILGQDSPTGQPDVTPKPLAARRQGLRRPPGRTVLSTLASASRGQRTYGSEDLALHPRGTPAVQARTVAPTGHWGGRPGAAPLTPKRPHACPRLHPWTAPTGAKAGHGQHPGVPTLSRTRAFSGTAVTRPTHRAGGLLSRSSVHNLRPTPDRRPLKGTLTTRLSCLGHIPTRKNHTHSLPPSLAPTHTHARAHTHTHTHTHAD